jgi:hypothetical protein
LYGCWRTERPRWEGYSAVGERIALVMRIDPLIQTKGIFMNNIVYIVGAIVIIVAVLSFLGLR